MPNAELPDDPWSRLLVGHQWPGPSALSALRGAAGNRSAIAAAMDGYADTLAAARHGPLAAQDGLAADALRERFRGGESLARELARRNAAKQTAYARACEHVEALRAELAEIARGGRGTIAGIQSSAEPAAAKIARITQVVLACQTAANIAGGKHAANVLDAVQRVLTATDPAAGARQFAAGHGVDVGGAFGSPSPAAAARAVRDALQSFTAR